jgi:hypothetical protein
MLHEERDVTPTPNRRSSAAGHRLEPPVPARVEGDQVVLRISGPLDRRTTDALAEAMNATLSCGHTLVLDLTPATDVSSGATALRPAGPPTGTPFTAIGAGLIRVTTVATTWTIDVAGRRLATGHPTMEPRFVPPHGWMPIRSVTVRAHTVTAVSAAGDDLVVSALRTAGAPACSLSSSSR